MAIYPTEVYLQNSIIYVQYDVNFKSSLLNISITNFIIYKNEYQIDFIEAIITDCVPGLIEIQLTFEPTPQDVFEITYFNSTTYQNIILSDDYYADGYYKQNVDNRNVIPYKYDEIFTWINNTTETLSISPLFAKTTTNFYPCSSLLIDRSSPVGNILFNEGGGLNILHFSGFVENPIENPGTFVGNYQILKKYVGIKFKSFGQQTITNFYLSVGISTAVVNDTDSVVIKIFQDINNRPSPNLVGISSSYKYSDLILNDELKDFEFINSPTLISGNYWFVLSPSNGSRFPTTSNFIFNTSPVIVNDYFIGTKTSSDNKTWTTLNYNLECGIAASSGIAVASNFIKVDALNDYISEATNFGGSEQPSKFETIGDGISRFLISTLLTPKRLKSIEILTLSNSNMQYLVEISENGVDYTSIFSMISNNKTNKIYRFTFLEPIEIEKIKIGSLGAFYFSSNDGTITVAARDKISQVTGYQISRYDDFRDVNLDSFLPFEEGIFSKSIEIIDLDSIYNDFGFKTNLNPNFVAYFVLDEDIYYIYSDKNSIYKSLLDADLESAETIFEIDFADEAITSLETIDNIIYIGTSTGSIYKSSDTITFFRIYNNSGLDSINCFKLYGSNIYAGILDIDSEIKILELNLSNTSNVFAESLWASSIPETNILSFTTGLNYLFIAASYYNNNSGSIYAFNGQDIISIFNTNQKIYKIYYSDFDNRLYVGIHGGLVYYSDFDANNLSTGFKLLLQLDGDKILSLQDASNLQYLSIITDDAFFVYDKENDLSYFNSYPSVDTSQYGLKTIWYNFTDTYDYNDIGKYVEYYDQINFTTTPDYIEDNNAKAIIDGYLYYTTSGTRNYKIIYNGSVSIFIDDYLIILSSTDTFSLYFAAAEYKKIHIEYTKTTEDDVAILRFLNNDTSLPVSLLNLLNPINITNICLPTTTNEIVIGSNRKLYTFNLEESITYKKNIYIRFKDNLNNQTDIELAYNDFIYKEAQKSVFSDNSPSGVLLEINQSRNIVSTFAPSDGSNQLLFAPDKIIRSKSYYISEPIYVPEITSWDEILIYAILPPGVVVEDLDFGTELKVYIRNGDDVLDLNGTKFSDPEIISTINNALDYSSGVLLEINLSAYSKKWLQFKLELLTATENVTPIVRYVIVRYFASGQSKFFTKIFDTSIHNPTLPAPTIRRGILTANFVENGGNIKFGYTTETLASKTFDFTQYTIIEANKLFELEDPSSSIRFGILLTTGTDIACVVDDFGIQLDTGEDDVLFMPPNALFEYTVVSTESGTNYKTIQFYSLSTGHIQTYIWNFGTSSSNYIGDPVNSSDDLIINRINPKVKFTITTSTTVTLTLEGFEQDGIIFESEAYSVTIDL